MYSSKKQQQHEDEKRSIETLKENLILMDFKTGKLLQLLAEVFNNTECRFRINYILLSRFLYFEESLMFIKVELGDVR